jgi:DNA-binding NarL/FixJ family response regulator
MARPIDTSIEAHGRQLEAYRAMRPADRLRLADQMSADVRTLTRSGIRACLVGDASEEDFDAALERILLGATVAAALSARHPAGQR